MPQTTPPGRGDDEVDVGKPGTTPTHGRVPGEGPSEPSALEEWLARFSGEWIAHAQDIVSAAVAAALIAMAGAVFVAGVVDFATGVSDRGLESASTGFIDKVLLVLILVEIVHTVVLSLRAHALAAQPFIVVGLVAVIRKILLGLASEKSLPTAELWVYVGMVAVFVAALVAIETFGRSRSRRTEGT